MRRVASRRSVLASTFRTNDLPYRVQKSRNVTLDGIPQNVGVQSVSWDGRSSEGRKLSAGVYFYRLSTPDFNETKKMILTR